MRMLSKTIRGKATQGRGQPEGTALLGGWVMEMDNLGDNLGN